MPIIYLRNMHALVKETIKKATKQIARKRAERGRRETHTEVKYTMD